MKWIKLKDRKPSVDIDGEKILVYRILNEGQKGISTSIFTTHMVKHCDENETWWMALPNDPIQGAKQELKIFTKPPKEDEKFIRGLLDDKPNKEIKVNKTPLFKKLAEVGKKKFELTCEPDEDLKVFLDGAESLFKLLCLPVIVKSVDWHNKELKEKIIKLLNDDYVEDKLGETSPNISADAVESIANDIVNLLTSNFKKNIKYR